MSAKQAIMINGKLQGSVVTYLRYGGVVNNQIKKGLLLKFEWIKSVNIWHSCKQKRSCIKHFARLVNTLLKDGESVQDSHVFASNFAKYSPILIFFTLWLSFKPF